VTGEGRAPLPIVPPPFRDERLSSWLERVADVYLVSLNELQSHVGWSRPALQLEFELVPADMERIASATHRSIERVLAMTFRGVPPRYRSLLRPGSRETCPACSRGMQRPQRLKGWSFAFAFWCDRHGEPLFGREMNGVSALGNEALGRRGAEILLQWAMEREATAVPVGSVLSLLLLPSQKPSPPAPWELGCLPLARQHDPAILSRPCGRPVLTVVVPEFRVAVPICDQRLPSTIAGLPGAPRAERYALAIGVARVLRNLADVIGRILEVSDAFGRKKVMALMEQWPVAIRHAVGHATPWTRLKGEGGRTARTTLFRHESVRAVSRTSQKAETAPKAFRAP
jgi:hypothetical protein